MKFSSNGTKKQKKKTQLSRKELRKQQRDEQKNAKKHHFLHIKKRDTAAEEDTQLKPSSKGMNGDTTARTSTTKKKSLVELAKEAKSAAGAAAGGKKKQEVVRQGKEKKGKSAAAPLPFELKSADPDIEAEEKEIKRLEKLMGIDKGKDRTKAASKLNKEYELFEGIGGKFGDFLMDLDDLADMLEGKGGKDKVFAGDDGDDEEEEGEEGDFDGMDDDDDEYSDEDDDMDEDEDGEEGGNDRDDNDIDDEEDGDDDDEEGENDDGDDAEEEEEDGWGSDEDDGGMEYEDDDDDNDDSKGKLEEDDNDDEEEEDGSGNSDVDGDGDDSGDDGEADEDDDRVDDSDTYRPTTGEDIYGRPLDAVSAAATGKYVPPARRAQLMATIDESSESVRIVRKRMNGLFNRLSEQTKDSIAREMKTIFDTNSISVGNVVLKDCVLASCGNSSQMMISLVPIYAAVIAAMHVTKGVEVGAYMIENLTVSLHKAIRDDREKAAAGGKKPTSSKSAGEHDYITSKLPSNILLLLIYLYNLRVLHHTLIVDVMNLLAFSTDSECSSKTETSLRPVTELEAELLVCIVDHCGVQLRADDPVALKDAITALSKRSSAAAKTTSDVNASGRVRFMVEALADLKNNKSRRAQSANAEIVKNLRKWLGSIKGSIGANRPGGDVCLRVTLTDLLDAEKKGRWWKAGARWVGRAEIGDDKKRGGDAEDDEQENSDDEEEDGDDGDDRKVNKKKKEKKAAVTTEEQQLLDLASKMRFTTSVRKNIFVVMMSSRDVNDAYERLQRLELKGKQDREIMRVITECCAQEKSYNGFYAELASLLCANNRQYKTTLQYTFWDNFKLFVDEEEVAERRVVNLARFLSHVVAAFHIPLAVLKPIEMAELNSHLVLFLATFFMAIFSAKISDETFQTILDRVATTKDFAIVRDNILMFLQRHLKRIPKGLESSEMKAMERRRKLTVKTMEQMAVLDMAAGEAEDRD